MCKNCTLTVVYTFLSNLNIDYYLISTKSKQNETADCLFAVLN